jgi:FdhE protein
MQKDGPVSDPKNDTQAVKDKLEALIARNPAYKEMCEFVGGLLLQTMGPGLGGAALDIGPQVDDSKLAQGKPLLDRDTLELDWPRVWDLAERLAREVDKRPKGAGTAQVMTNLRAEARGGAGLLRAVLNSDYQALEKAAQEQGSMMQAVGLVMRLALRPQMLSAAEAACGKTDIKAWSFGHCPVCGSAPGLAALSGPDGDRTLHCALCETSWSYPRLKCPFCEKQEPGSISYIKAENEEGLQAELCAGCGQYIKTLDLRQVAGPVIMPLDDAASWHLDLIAQRSGTTQD